MILDVTTAGADLERILSRVVGVTNEKSPMPILECVLLRATGDGSLHVAASDMLNAVSGAIAGETKHAGSVAVPAKKLYDRVKALPQGPVRVRVDDKLAVTVKGDGARQYTMHGAPGEDYPPIAMSAGPDAPTSSIPAEALANVIERSHFAMCLDESRPHLAALLVQWSAGSVTAVSTDGHRMALFREPVEAHSDMRLLLSTKTVKELRRHCSGVFAGAPVSIALDRSTVYFTGNGLTFAAKLVDAQFLPYEQFLTAAPPCIHVRVSKERLIDTVRAVSIASEESEVTCTIDGSRIVIEGESDKGGKAIDEVVCEVTADKGRQRVVPFTVLGKYLVDALTATTTEDVTLGMTESATDPIRVLAADRSEAQHNIVMPRIGKR